MYYCSLFHMFGDINQMMIIERLCLGVALLSLMFLGLSFITFEDEMHDLKSGKTRLYCYLPDGVKEIPHHRVTDKHGPYWIFDNGSASNCWTE